jgi:hypothetical protein
MKQHDLTWRIHILLAFLGICLVLWTQEALLTPNTLRLAVALVNVVGCHG